MSRKLVRPTTLTDRELDALRADVQRGAATHDCGEWETLNGTCRLCDRVLASRPRIPRGRLLLIAVVAIGLGLLLLSWVR
jgi:hypothetical protein